MDRYEPQLFALAVGILILSCLDAAFTLALIARGVVTTFQEAFSRFLADEREKWADLVKRSGAKVD